MSYVQNRVDDYHKNRADLISGKKKNMPFAGLPKIGKFVPGIIPGIMYKITSGSGAGKTNFAKFAFVYQPIFYAIKYHIDYKVIYFALEESKEEFIDGLFIHILKRAYNLDIDRFTLSGNGLSMLTQKELEVVEQAKHYVNQVMERITVIDDKYKPSEMMKACRRIAEKEGKFIVNAKGEEEYKPYNPAAIRLVISDHVSLIEEEFDTESERFLDKPKAIAKWHTEYLRKTITKKWGWAGLNIQQQGLDSEKQVFTNKGDTVVNKLLPTMDGLANNREVARDDYVIFALFAPERFELPEYHQYKVCDKATPTLNFYDNIRFVTIIKNRFGIPNKMLPLWFDGSYNFFEELPLPHETALLQKFLDRRKP